jgi:hypothetical protein
MKALFSCTTPSFWVLCAAIAVLAQIPAYRDFYQAHKPFSDFAVVVLSASTLKRRAAGQ